MSSVDSHDEDVVSISLQKCAWAVFPEVNPTYAMVTLPLQSHDIVVVLVLLR